MLFLGGWWCTPVESAFHLGVLCRMMQGKSSAGHPWQAMSPHISCVPSCPFTAVSSELWLCRLCSVNCFASVIEVTLPVAQSLGEADTLPRLLELLQAPSLVLPQNGPNLPSLTLLLSSFSLSLIVLQVKYNWCSWMAPSIPSVSFNCRALSAGSLRQSCTPFSVPAEDVSYSWGWIDVWLKAVGCSPTSVHGCHFDSTKQTAKFLNGSVPEKLFWVLFCFFCSGTVPIIASLKLLHMGADCSWVRQGRGWHWIAGIKSQLPFWTLSCTSVVCSFILPVLFCSKMKHCGKLMLLVQWSLLGVAVLCNHPTQPLAAPTEMPEVQISSFLMGDTASIPAVILGCFAGCISNLHPQSRFLSSSWSQLA